MRVHCEGERCHGTSRQSRLAFVLSLAAVASIVVVAFAAFPEGDAAVETVHLTADEVVAQSDEATPDMNRMLKNYEKKTTKIASKYDNQIKGIVTSDHRKSTDEDAENSADSTHAAKTATASDDEHAALAEYEGRLEKQDKLGHSTAEAAADTDPADSDPADDVLAQLESSIAELEEEQPKPSLLQDVDDADLAAPAPATSPDAVAAAQDQAAEALKSEAEAAKSALKLKLKRQQKKAKAKEKERQDKLKREAAEAVKRTKERKGKEVAAGMPDKLQNTGLNHLKSVIARGKARVKRASMRAQGKVYHQVRRGIRDMQEAPEGRAAIKAAQGLRRKAKNVIDDYEGWKMSKEADIKQQKNQARYAEIKEDYKTSYETDDASDRYNDAVQRIEDEREAGIRAGTWRVPSKDAAEAQAEGDIDAIDTPDVDDVDEVADEETGDADVPPVVAAPDATDDAASDDAAALAAGTDDADTTPTSDPALAAADADAAAAPVTGSDTPPASEEATAATDDNAADAPAESQEATADGTPPAYEEAPGDAVKEALRAQFASMMATLQSPGGDDTAESDAAEVEDVKKQVEDAKKDADKTEFIPKATFAPLDEQDKAVGAMDNAPKIVHAEPAPKNAKLGVNVGDIKLQPTTTEHDKPNIPNPAQGEHQSPSEHSGEIHQGHEIAGEKNAPAVIMKGAIIEKINDIDARNSKRDAYARIKATEDQKEAAKEAKKKAELAAWTQARRDGEKRALPLVQEDTKKYKDKHWNQVWGAFEHRNRAKQASGRERMHLVRPDEPREGDQGAQGIPRISSEPSLVHSTESDEAAVPAAETPAEKPELVASDEPKPEDMPVAVEPKADDDEKQQQQPAAEEDEQPPSTQDDASAPSASDSKQDAKKKKAGEEEEDTKVVSFLSAGIYSHTKDDEDVKDVHQKHVDALVSGMMHPKPPPTVLFSKLQEEKAKEEKMSKQYKNLIDGLRKKNDLLSETLVTQGSDEAVLKRANTALVGLLKENHIRFDHDLAVAVDAVDAPAAALPTAVP